MGKESQQERMIIEEQEILDALIKRMDESLLALDSSFLFSFNQPK